LAASGLPQTVQALSPAEVVLTQIKLCILAAAIFGAPWILYQAWLFISPGLYHHERRFVNLLVPGSAVLTVSGVLLLYYFMMPIMLTVMIGIGANVRLSSAPVEIEPRVQEAMALRQPIMTLSEAPADADLVIGYKWKIWPDESRAYIAVAKNGGGVEAAPLPAGSVGTIAQQLRLSEYNNFVLIMTLGTVIGFQLPLVVMLMGWVGLATPEWFRAKRKYAMFFCGVAAAIITPSSDLISMLVMMLPLYLLYELGIVLLVLAPAKKVAEGRVIPLPRWPWKWRRKSEPNQPDNPAANSSAAAQTAQVEREGADYTANAGREVSADASTDDAESERRRCRQADTDPG
jgi:Sec-independent protein secretion pathway component TatC